MASFLPQCHLDFCHWLLCGQDFRVNDSKWRATVVLRAAVFFSFWISIDLLLKRGGLNLCTLEVYNDTFVSCFLKQKKKVHPVTEIWQEENNLWLLHQFYKINVILSYEQWGIKFVSEFKFSVVTTHNSKVADFFPVQISKLFHKMKALLF